MSHLSDGIARHRKYKRPLGCVRFSREWRQWRKSNQQICVNKHTSGRVYRRFRRHIRVLRFMARANSGPTSGDFQRRRPLMETFGATRRWLEEIRKTYKRNTSIRRPVAVRTEGGVGGRKCVRGRDVGPKFTSRIKCVKYMPDCSMPRDWKAETSAGES